MLEAWLLETSYWRVLYYIIIFLGIQKKGFLKVILSDELEDQGDVGNDFQEHRGKEKWQR